MPPPDPRPASGDTPRVVLDTNAALDWLWFDDPAMQPLGHAIASGTCRWLQTPAMRDELMHVVVHRLPPRAGADTATVDAACRRWAQSVAVAAPAPWSCRDADDQMFLDLAYSARAAWLVTRDRALLVLARRTRQHGLHVVTPAAWPWPQTAASG